MWTRGTLPFRAGFSYSAQGLWDPELLRAPPWLLLSCGVDLDFYALLLMDFEAVQDAAARACLWECA